MQMSVSFPRNHRWLSAESSLSICGTSVGRQWAHRRAPAECYAEVCAERSKEISVASELRKPTPSVGGCYPGYGRIVCICAESADSAQMQTIRGFTTDDPQRCRIHSANFCAGFQGKPQRIAAEFVGFP